MRVVSLLLTAAVMILMVSCQRAGSTLKSVNVTGAAAAQGTAKAAEVAPSSEPAVAAATAGQDENVTASKSAEAPASEMAAKDGETVKQDENVADAEAARPDEPARKPTDGSASAVPPAAPVAPDQSGNTSGTAAAKPSGSTAASQGAAAIEKAAVANKYLFIFFYKADDEQTQAMRKVFDAAVMKIADRAQYAVIDVKSPSEQPIVKKYGLDRAPMPLALVLAPTGAITGGFPTRFEENQLTSAFVSQGMAKSLKALQDGKLVLLCAQNDKTKANDAAMQGVSAFMADTRFAKTTEVVRIDPTDDREQKFLTQMQIDPKTNEAVTALITPPGSVVAKYNGKTDKDVMIAALAALKAGGGGG